MLYPQLGQIKTARPQRQRSPIPVAPLTNNTFVHPFSLQPPQLTHPRSIPCPQTPHLFATSQATPFILSITWKCSREARESLKWAGMVDGMRQILRSASMSLLRSVRPRRSVNPLGAMDEGVLSWYQKETPFSLSCIAWMRICASIHTDVKDGADGESEGITSTSVMLRI